MLIDAASNKQAFRGIEKAIFYRICKLLTRNIQLIFVFDVQGVPAKRGRKAGRRVDFKLLRDLKTVLRCFGIPYQEAPGEAEAECARLQILGLVDAVWSQDSDCLMFGCGLWIHDDRIAKEKGNKNHNKANTKKSDKRIRIVRAIDMEARLNLNREGLVLFAMLAGGDYNEVGLRGCGAATALSAVKEGKLARALCLCRNQEDCAEWSHSLVAFLQTQPRAQNVAIPANFPDYKILQNYYKPKVTADELLLAKRSLDLGVSLPIRERELLGVTSSFFNIWGRRYMNWIAPVLLTRSLVKGDASCAKEVIHDIKLVKQRATKDEEAMALRRFAYKIAFSPFEVTSFRREDLEGGEREGMWDGAMHVPFDPNHLVECDYFPAVWLQRALPTDVLEQPHPKVKQKHSKRKERSDADVLDEGSEVIADKRLRVKDDGQTARAIHTIQPNKSNPNRPQQPACKAPSPRAQTAQSNIKFH